MVMTPEQIVAKDSSEHGHQMAFMQWCALKGWRKIFAVPNGGDRKLEVAMAMQAEGTKSGVPDMCVPVCRGGYPGLWIELKKPGLSGRKNGNRQDSQIKWQKWLREEHYAVATAYGWIACAWVLFTYSTGHLIMPEGGDCLFATEAEAPPVVERLV